MTSMAHMWAAFAIIAVAMVGFTLERIAIEITALATVVALITLFTLFPLPGPGGVLVSPEVLLAGFANPALITVLSLLVVGQGLFQTGAIDGITRKLSNKAVTSPKLTIASLLIAAGALSAFMNNTPLVVIVLPVLAAIGSRSRIPASRFMMPLSFIAILGGSLTLIGSSTNLLVAGVARDMGLDRITFFEITPVAMPLVLVGIAYVLFAMPPMLKPRASLMQEVAGGDKAGKQFVVRIRIDNDHFLVGAKSAAGMFPQLKGMTVLMVQRGPQNILPPYEDVELASGDTLIVAATRQTLADSMRGRQQLINPDQLDDDPAPQGSNHVIVAEAVVAPGSRLAGRTIETASLAATTGCFVLGFQRQSRMTRVRIGDIRMEPGDVLLVGGQRDDIARLRLNRDVILLEWSAEEVPINNRAAWGIAIFAVTVALAATEMVPLVLAALAGAIAMVIAGCLNVHQAARAFDRRIYLLVGSALAMATALEATGGAQLVAHGIVETFSGAPTAVLLSALFITIAIFTNILSNNATAVLFTPIAVTAALELGIDPHPFVMTVILAANCSFATPIGYQTNLLVMAPGHYKFADFLKAGVPLVLLMWLTFSIAAPFVLAI
ncbi:SLC13 family permease [Tepidamorphus sp. 3E244]|uniref:SLC13 family permease n=1 Tax=Tepidamorphus sp. 3E244 TaxID=3385498 RepID=UPI0038FC2C99